MDMTTIQRSVSDAWQFIFPPVLTVFFLFITAYLIVGAPVLLPFKKVTAYGLNLLQDANSEKIIEFYGISKLMPIIALFAIVSLLYLSMLAVQFVGNVLPVTPTYNPDMLFLSIDHSDRLARIWSRFPSVQTFSSLRIIIQERSYKAEKELDKRFLGIEKWKSEAGARYTSFLTSKFFVLWSLLCLVAVGIWGTPFVPALLRTLGILGIVCAPTVFFGAQFFYATEQLAHAQLNAVDAILVSEDTRESSGKTEPEDLEKFRNLVSHEKAGRPGATWWDIRIFDKYFYQWAYRTFIKV